MFISTAEPVWSRCRDLLDDVVDLETQALNLLVPRRQSFLHCVSKYINIILAHHFSLRQYLSLISTTRNICMSCRDNVCPSVCNVGVLWSHSATGDKTGTTDRVVSWLPACWSRLVSCDPAFYRGRQVAFERLFTNWMEVTKQGCYGCMNNKCVNF